jgi:RNA polymerase sigma factor (sigma-70 family)
MLNKQPASIYLSEESLTKGLANGEKEALGELFSKYYDKIINSLKFKFPAIDLLDIDAYYTDSCIDLFEQLKSGRHSDVNLYNLLYTICIRKVIGLVRKQVRSGVLKDFNLSEEDSRFLDKDENSDDNYFMSELGDDIWGDGDDMEEWLQKLESAMKELSEKCNEIITLKYLKELSWEEVASTMNINADTARKATTPRCKDDLRNILVTKYGFKSNHTIK